MTDKPCTITEMVTEFHEKFGHPVGKRPRMIDEEEARFRLRLIQEEVAELAAAMIFEDLIETADALADIAYVVWGTAICLGINLEEVVEEVHEANMRKLWPDGKPRYREDGKILKPNGWTPPDVEGVLYDQRQYQEWLEGRI